MAAARQLDGLSEGLAYLLERAQHHRPTAEVIARRITIEEAGEFIGLLSLTVPGRGVGAVVFNSKPLASVDRSAHVLRALKDRILPMVHAQPTSARHLLLLLGCARGLRDDATAGGGTFGASAREMAAKIEAFVEGARNHPASGDYRLLRGLVDGLSHDADRLLHTTCTIRHEAFVEAVAQAAAEGADDEDAAAE